jgi:hypothetical protein
MLQIEEKQEKQGMLQIEEKQIMVLYYWQQLFYLKN